MNLYDKFRIGLTAVVSVAMVIGNVWLFVNFFNELVEQWWIFLLVPLAEIVCIRMMLHGSYCVMTIDGTTIKLNSATAVYDDMRTKLTVNDSFDLYIKKVDYAVNKHGHKTSGLLLSKYPIKASYDVEIDGFDDYSVVVKNSEKFIDALRENFNCHFENDGNV